MNSKKDSSYRKKIELLIKKGVKIIAPESVYIADDVDVSRISGENVIFYPCTKIMGKNTLIMENTTLGFESPVTLENVLIGKNTKLNGGFFQQCAFLGSNSVGSGAHFRAGTILEEEADAAHTVGLKQTILFPFATLGSLINFCDCLMAGGTSRKDHSEVGSSFIHFNYTPNQDKATPSMFGNVHQGVMLKSSPIFLGGQGGIVGPCRLAFGSVTAAGTIWRKDITESNKIMFGGALKEMVIERKKGVYSNVKRIFDNNCCYIAGLISLMWWYLNVRSIFAFKSGLLSQQLFLGVLNIIKSAIDERISRLQDFVKKVSLSKDIILSNNGGKITPLVEEHKLVINKWESAEIFWEDIKSMKISEDKLYFDSICRPPPQQFISIIKKRMTETNLDYIQTIQSLDKETADMGSSWLEAVESNILKCITFDHAN